MQQASNGLLVRSSTRNAPLFRRFWSQAAVFRDLVRTEGVHGLFKGLSVNYFKAPIAMGISFSMYHKLKEIFDAADWP